MTPTELRELAEETDVDVVAGAGTLEEMKHINHAA